MKNVKTREDSNQCSLELMSSMLPLSYKKIYIIYETQLTSKTYVSVYWPGLPLSICLVHVLGGCHFSPKSNDDSLACFLSPSFYEYSYYIGTAHSAQYLVAQSETAMIYVLSSCSINVKLGYTVMISFPIKVQLGYTVLLSFPIKVQLGYTVLLIFQSKYSQDILYCFVVQSKYVYLSVLWIQIQ